LSGIGHGRSPSHAGRVGDGKRGGRRSGPGLRRRGRKKSSRPERGRGGCS
jgi:hypothetical protein